MLRYAITIFLSAFLLFQVQPLFGKFILPWFGGTPAVWTTCMLFFQVLLLGGYAYAHFSISRLTPRQQGMLHLIMLAISLAFLPIIPSESWKPSGLESPTWRILGVLAFTIGVPYLVISSTAPLLQAWFSRDLPGRSPYRLYALSNFGSLLGLLSYPFVVEPNLTLKMQGYTWSALFVAFVVLCGVSAWKTRSATAPVLHTEASTEAVKRPSLFDIALWVLLPMCGSVMLLATTNHMSQDVAAVPFLWVLPLSLYLLSFIITFDSPRWYWRPVWAWLLPLCVGGAYMAIRIGTSLDIVVQVTLYCAALMACCMVLHGELARIKPAPRYLTGYFLMISAGGALGGILVSLVAPHVLSGFYEYPVALLLSCFLFAIVIYRQVYADLPAGAMAANLATFIILAGIGVLLVQKLGVSFTDFNGFARDKATPFIDKQTWDYYDVKQRLYDALDQTWQIFGFLVMSVLMLLMVLHPPRKGWNWPVAIATGIIALIAGMISTSLVAGYGSESSIAVSRNFYGVLRVDEHKGGFTEEGYRTLMHGRITHGIQRLDAEGRTFPTTYYSEDSGVGIAIRQLREMTPGGKGPLRIGVVGLGTGTLAAYGKAGDFIRFYEINRDVLRLNDEYFTFRRDTPAKGEVVMGDARITMERERRENKPANLDLLAVDAFSGDAVPLHLLTREAFANYFYHLKPDGVLAVHVSNLYLDLEPLVHDLAAADMRMAVKIESEDDYSQSVYSSTWILVTKNQRLLESELVKTYTTSWPAGDADRKPLIFTDDYSNIFRILRRSKSEASAGE